MVDTVDDMDDAMQARGSNSNQDFLVWLVHPWDDQSKQEPVTKVVGESMHESRGLHQEF